MKSVVSKDGTTIAYDQVGQGPAVILVDGAFGSRTFGPMPQLAPLLASDFTVFTYDRRGRGDSGDTAPYAVEREIDDLDALIKAAGGSALVCAISSGAVLALDAAAHGASITKLAVYEPPVVVDNSRAPMLDDYVARFNELVAAGRRGDAAKLMM